MISPALPISVLLPVMLGAETPHPGSGDGGHAAAGASADPTALEAFATDALFFVVNLGLAMVALGIVLCLGRILRGPTLVDRGIAADTLALQIVALVVLITIRFSTLVMFDAVLVIAILGFTSTVAFARFIGRRRSAV